ncbi:MAG: heparin lyase I family protein [Proteobacteria bacterium]|nr:heparin lyase I family protein [Pseudomonadota bacterium]
MRRWAWAMSTVVSLLPALGLADAGADQGPIFTDDFEQTCVLNEQGQSPDWRISALLDKQLWPERIRCVEDESTGTRPRVLRIAIHPGDAYDPNPGSNPTERVEIQVRHEIVRFDHPVWYAFRFRLAAPWIAVANRTVIHQIKQNLAPSWEAEHGGPCPAANPFFKIEADADSHGPIFLVKTRGTENCKDGKAATPICGPWPLRLDHWHWVHVLLKPSQRAGDSELLVWLDGRACAPFTGMLGYLDHGKRDAGGRPIVDTQPRFGIYRDALGDVVQSIEFADIAFWSSSPSGHPAWHGIRLGPGAP